MPIPRKRYGSVMPAPQQAQDGFYYESANLMPYSIAPLPPSPNTYVCPIFAAPQDEMSLK